MDDLNDQIHLEDNTLDVEEGEEIPQVCIYTLLFHDAEK